MLSKVGVLLNAMNVTLAPVKEQESSEKPAIRAIKSFLKEPNVKAEFAAKLREKYFNFSTAFRKLDENHDGYIDIDEFHKAVFKLGMMLAHRERTELFETLDVKKRGKVTYTEFSKLLDDPTPPNMKMIPRHRKFNLRPNKLKPLKLNGSFDGIVSVSKRDIDIRSKSVKPFL